MAGVGSSSLPPVFIGNCKVAIEGSGISCESSETGLVISVSNNAKINITVDEPKLYSRRKSFSYQKPDIKYQIDAEMGFPTKEHFFLLLNPKDVDSQNKTFLQEVLKLYTEELPSMNYAANTGKKSPFLEKCILSGKYQTLILRAENAIGPGEVVAAASYQIIPSDTQYAEIPLAAVSSKNQNMGIGRALFKELKERLQNVGILQLFCWADKTSEGFWLKQGFIPVGEVDGKGKAGKLPVKANIRKALSFPGGSMLMVAQLKKVTPSKISLPHSIGCKSGEIELTDADDKDDTSEQRLKRPLWEASLSSLKLKRIRGAHLVSCPVKSNQDFPCDNCFAGSSGCNDMAVVLPDHSSSASYLGTDDAGKLSSDTCEKMAVKQSCPRVIFMDIANDAKKILLTKIVEELGGSVTCDGSDSTHIITGKARRTLNFSIALCSGAWIVSPNWLKSSFKEGRFAEESQFILEDEDYLLKYKTKLRDAVERARRNPHSLLRGYDVCLAKHIQPSAATLSAIIQSAGGHVIKSLSSILEPSKTIFLACEEDMSEAMAAAKKSIWTFNSEWFMNCVMKQELDLEAPQFAESL
ncbi:uncharacterized protein LOC122041593 [Zingiber officinale]|uniref:N-acetyltransferase n=1 Tax=Zingiber officinale TaxID=94328 RepID=A0A8J5I0H4_ZINOF|nr:uncharacterized protein LOC122041593 [Zingiber officinale]KAG6528382.1 hypothetical protein ZIOFF_010537 [Zingiber officinale]